MRVALVHDWFPAYRGGERVVSSLLGLFPEADVFTLFDFLSQAERDEYFGGREVHRQCDEQLAVGAPLLPTPVLSLPVLHGAV